MKLNDLVLCEFDTLTVALPRTDVIRIEYGRELSAPIDTASQAQESLWSVYALTGHLHLTTPPDAGKPFVILLAHDTERLGLLCDTVTVGGASALTWQPIPVLLLDGRHPFTRMTCLDEGKLAWYCGQGALAHYVLTELARG